MKYLLKIAIAFIFFSLCIAANSGELEVRDAIRNNSKNLVFKEDFSELEKLFKQYDTTKEETPSGALKINLLTDGINTALRLRPKFSKEEDYIRKEELLKRWIKAHPESIMAHIMYASTFADRAWMLRGEGAASTVPKEAWEPYYKYLNLQNNYLDKHKNILSTNILWYLEKLMNRKHLSKQSEFGDIYKEAVSKDIQDMRIYSVMIASLSPRWGGSAEKIDDFINSVAKNSKTDSSDYIYSRLYASAEQDLFPHQLFEKSKADWPRMKRGFEQRLIKNPDVWNENIYAKYACQAKDKETSRKLIARIGNSPELTVWEPNAAYWFSYCRDWAASL